MTWYLYLALFSVLIGLWASSYLHRKKRAKQKLVCPLRANCEKVIHSTHATTLGIPNELLGMAYYIMLGILYSLMLAMPSVFMAPIVSAAVAILSLIGVLFSAYLVVIQIVVLRAWCSWCMLSAVANVLLAVAAMGLRFF